jgi:branched-chain amino acid transport system substrate-binding protein
MTRIFKALASASATITLALATTGLAGAADTTPLNLNVILPLTGPGTFIGKAEQDTLTALELVVNKEGGVRGRPVKFVIHDDGTNAGNAVQLFNQINVDKPNVLFGPGLAGMCLAVAPLVASGPVDYCYSPAIHPKAGSFVFSGSVSTSDFAVAFYRYFASQGYKKIAIISSTDASGQDADNAFNAALDLPENKAAGLTIIDKEHFNATDLSVDAQMQRIKASGAQVVVCYAPGTPFGTLLQGVKQAGIDVPIATGNANMTYAQMKQYASFMPATLLFPGLPFLAHLAPTPAAKKAQDDFYAAFKSLNIRPDVSHSTAWDPTQIVVAALRALGPDAPADKVRAWIADLHDFTGIDGPYDFRDGSQRGLSEKNLLIMKWDPSKDTWTAVSGPGGAPLH